MDENLHNIEDLFYAALDKNEEEIPSKHVWEKIDKRLDKDNAVSIRRKYKALKRVSIVLLVLLGIAVYKLETGNVSYIRTEQHTQVDQNKQRNAGEKAGIQISVKKQDRQSVNGKKTIAVVSDSHEDLILDTLNKKVQTTDKGIYTSKEESQFKNQFLPRPGGYKEKYILKEEQLVKGRQKITGKALQQGSIKISTDLLKSESISVYVTGEQYGYIIPFLKKINIIPVKIFALPIFHSTDIRQSPPIVALSETTISKTQSKQFTKKTQPGARHFSITPFLSPDIVWYHLDDDKPL